MKWTGKIPKRILNALFCFKDKANCPEAASHSEICKTRQYPSSLTIGITERCNLNCFICNRALIYKALNCTSSFLDPDKINLLEAPIRHAEEVGLNAFGETLLHPDFGEIVKRISKINPSNNLITLVTNGTLLSREIGYVLQDSLRYLAISLNAPNAEFYEKEMHFPFQETLNRIEDFLSGIDEGTRDKVALHYVVHKDNILQMPEFVKLARKLGVNRVNFTHYMVVDAAKGNLSVVGVKDLYNETVEKALIIGEQLGVTVQARKFYSETKAVGTPEDLCFSVYREAFINVSGEVLPCCYTGTLPNLGNAYQTSFEDVWFGDRYGQLREKRFLRECQRCNTLLPFDNYLVHLSPIIRYIYNDEQKFLDILAGKYEEYSPCTSASHTQNVECQ